MMSTKAQNVFDLIDFFENSDISFRKEGNILRVKCGLKHVSERGIIISSVEESEEIIHQYVFIKELVIIEKEKIKRVQFTEKVLIQYIYPHLIIYF